MLRSAIVALLVQTSLHAFAQEPPGIEGPSPEEIAYELFQASLILYEQGDYAEAARLLEQSYELDPEPILLYNLGRAYDRSGDAGKAIEAYERYLRESPDGEDRTEIETRLEELRIELDAERRAQLRPASAAPWIIAGGGALIAGLSLVLGVLAQDRHDDAVAEPEGLAASRQQEQAVRLNRAANGLYGTGGAIAVIGVIWGAIDLSRVVRPSDLGLEVTARRGGATVTFGARF